MLSLVALPLIWLFTNHDFLFTIRKKKQNYETIYYENKKNIIMRFLGGKCTTAMKINKKTMQFFLNDPTTGSIFLMQNNF